MRSFASPGASTSAASSALAAAWAPAPSGVSQAPDEDPRGAVRARILTAIVGSGDEHELSRGCGLLEQLVRAARVGQRQALGHDRVDIAAPEQLEQRQEVLAEPDGIPGSSPHGKRRVTSA